jgi:DNA-3-methyladenine glycosylase
MRLNKKFFSRNAKIVAKEILGKVLVRKIRGRKLRAKIVETEAYFGKDDPASRASKGKNKISEMMWEEPGKILVYNVHMYKMFNLITGKKGEPSAILIRAAEPLNFKNLRCSGPGLLTNSLNIKKDIHGEEIYKLRDLWIEEGKKNFEIIESFRIGVTKDLPEKMRFYIKGNEFVSRR